MSGVGQVEAVREAAFAAFMIEAATAHSHELCHIVGLSINLHICA
jgi:hypothetical protein